MDQFLFLFFLKTCEIITSSHLLLHWKGFDFTVAALLGFLDAHIGAKAFREVHANLGR